MSLPITVPYTFANATTAIPLVQLDTDLATVYSAVNGIANGVNALANVNIIGGTLDNVTIGSVTPGNGSFTNLVATTSNLGTITTGTWNGTAISVAKGGTGLTSTPSNGQLLIGNGSGFTESTLTAGSNITITNGAGSITIASTGGGGGGSGTVTSVDVSGGTTGLTYSGGPVTTSGTITMAGTLIVGNGGTGATTLTANSVVLGNGAGAVKVVAPGTSGNVLTSNGTTWTSAASTATASLTLLATLTTTSGTTQSATGLATTYTNFVCVFDGVNNSTGGDTLQVAVSANNGSSYGTAKDCSNASLLPAYGILQIWRANNNSVNHPGPYYTYQAGGLANYVTSTAGAINAIRFSWGAGYTFNAGAIYIYGWN